MARKNNSLNPAVYGLTQQDVDRVIRIHSMCKDMDEDAFRDTNTALLPLPASSGLRATAHPLKTITSIISRSRSGIMQPAPTIRTPWKLLPAS